MSDLIRIFTEHSDVAHLALLLWAGAGSFLRCGSRCASCGAASRRFDDFVREL